VFRRAYVTKSLLSCYFSCCCWTKNGRGACFVRFLGSALSGQQTLTQLQTPSGHNSYTFCPTSYTERGMVSYFTRGKYVAYDILFRSIFISFCSLLERYCRNNHVVIIPQAGVSTRVGDAHCRVPALPHQVAPLPRQWNFIASRYHTSSDIQIAIELQRVTALNARSHKFEFLCRRLLGSRHFKYRC
jgi:hypothetical protein